MSADNSNGPPLEQTILKSLSNVIIVAVYQPQL